MSGIEKNPVDKPLPSGALNPNPAGKEPVIDIEAKVKIGDGVPVVGGSEVSVRVKKAEKPKPPSCILS